MEDPKQIGVAVIAESGSHSVDCFCHFPTLFISNIGFGGLGPVEKNSTLYLRFCAPSSFLWIRSVFRFQLQFNDKILALTSAFSVFSSAIKIEGKPCAGDRKLCC